MFRVPVVHVMDSDSLYLALEVGNIQERKRKIRE
jgi:hypothetical protein